MKKGDIEAILTIKESLKYSKYYIENYNYSKAMGVEFHPNAYKMKRKKLDELDNAIRFINQLKTDKDESTN
jgi:hypothetical protein